MSPPRGAEASKMASRLVEFGAELFLFVAGETRTLWSWSKRSTKRLTASGAGVPMRQQDRRPLLQVKAKSEPRSEKPACRVAEASRGQTGAQVKRAWVDHRGRRFYHPVMFRREMARTPVSI